MIHIFTKVNVNDFKKKYYTNNINYFIKKNPSTIDAKKQII